MSKMIRCKTCGNEMDKNAKACPSCGAKNKKPIFKRWWFILIVLVVIIGALAPRGNKGKNTTDESQETTNTSTANANKDESKQEKAKDTTKENIPKEYQSALKKADSYANIMNFSKKGLYQQLTSDAGEKFTEEAAQYAIENVKTDWKKNALAKAKIYQNEMSMSKGAIHDQLVSDAGEKFTEEEAQYAVNNLEN